MNEQEPLVQPQAPDPLVQETRAFWREVGQGMVKDSLQTVNEAARQVIGVAGILEGLYFHAIAYSDLRGTVSGGALLVYLAPIALLLFSLLAALAVFWPDRSRVNIRSHEACQLVYERTVKYKLLALRLASGLLAAGIVAVFVAVWTYLGG